MTRTGCWLLCAGLTLLVPPLFGRDLAAPLAPLNGVSFRASEVGHPVQAWTIAQAAEGGAIFAGTADGVLEFDGLGWRPLVRDANLARVRALLLEGDARLWVGALSELGYIEWARESGNARFVSLRDRLPPNLAATTAIINIHRVGDRVYFVAEQEILAWDGNAFAIYPFPTADRLRSFVFEGETWGHHQETGLLRLTDSGFIRVHDATALKPNPILALIRAPAGVGVVSRGGVYLLGDPAAQLGPEATNELLRKQVLIAATPWGPDRLALGTLGGLVLVNRDLDVVQVLGVADGLPSSAVLGISVDHEGYLWACTLAGFFRLSSEEAALKVGLKGLGAFPSIEALTAREDGTLLVSSGGSLLALPPSAKGFDAPATRLSQHHSLITALHALDQGVLIGRNGGLDLAGRSGIRSIAEIAPGTIFGLVPLRARPGHFAVQHLGGVYLLAPNPAGEWSATSFARVVGGTTSAVEDRQGRLWVGTLRGDLLCLDLGDESLTRVSAVSPNAGRGARPLRLTGEGDLIFAAVGERLMRVDPATGQVDSLEGVPPIQTRLLQLAPNRRRLYVAFDRPAYLPARHGLGVVELDGTGRPVGWRDLALASLAQVGTPGALQITEAEGRETVWLGGSEGLLRIDPQELPTWGEPKQPRLTVTGEGRLEAPSTFAFGRHRVTIEVHPVENAARPLLGLETRLGDDGAWTPAERQTRFTYVQLDAGTYTFAARLKNPAGQAGPAATFSFRIAPPWYRSVWIYTGGLAVILAIVGGSMAWREHRARAVQKLLERLVRERTAALAQANAIKDDFLANLSHEIRNPLNGVVGLCATIDPSPLNEVERHRFGLLRQCAEHLASLLEEILDLARLQTGSVELRPQTFAPQELLASVRAIASAGPGGAAANIRTTVAADVPVYLVGDRRRLQQVLLNFVTNAIKYAGGSPIDVQASTRSAGDGRRELILTVADAGPGIPAADQERLFLKFERGAAARRHRIPGTGLGLAVCHQIAEAMGGSVGVESTPGQGATFFLRLPLALGTRPPLTASAFVAESITSREAALVVDDEDYNRVALGALLGTMGFEATTARDADAALSLVGQGRTFAVVLLDYDLPGMKGPALARSLRENLPADDQPVILATTAYATVEKRRECLEAGMDGFVGKPVTPARLGMAVTEALAVRRPGMGQRLPAPAETPPNRDGADPLDNLRLLAASRRRHLKEEFAAFAEDCAREFTAWREAAARRDHRQAARIAHHLAGRLGFVRAGSAAALALELESASAEGRWDAAARLLGSAAAEWARQEILLRGRLAVPAEPAHS